MENLIKIGEEQIKKLKKLQTNCVDKNTIDGETIHNDLIISNQIRDWCITIKECKDTKYENEIRAKNVENINKATGDLLNLIKVFAPNNKKSNAGTTVNNSSNVDIDKLVRNIKAQIVPNSTNLMK